MCVIFILTVLKRMRCKLDDTKIVTTKLSKVDVDWGLGLIWSEDLFDPTPPHPCLLTRI